MNAETFAGLKFRSIGPAWLREGDGDCGESEEQVRVLRGRGLGGVWKTVNDGTTWTPVFDKEASYSIGWVTLDPNDPRWCGWGRVRALAAQRGLWRWDYRSDDGGKDWQNLGLKKSEHIGRVVVDPRDSKVIM